MPKASERQAALHASTLLAILPEKTRRKREIEKLSLREAAEQIGIGFNTLYRLEQGVEVRTSAARKVLQWLAA